MAKWLTIGCAALALVFVGVSAVGFALWHNGYRVYVIHTGSMEPTTNPGDLIVDRPPAGHYRPGEIITFRHSSGPDVVTHRITDVTDGQIHTKGDANPTPDVWNLTPDMVQGSVRWTVPALGYFVVFLQQPTGIAALLTAILGLVLLWGLFFPPGDPVFPPGHPAVSTAPAERAHAPLVPTDA